ncbi:MAG TPA: Dabb family protein [Candidatus Baltobacteraceae bacterium]|jgi:hypothetical protein|nr:Dabb family protein [Candidatus Baltobacteraceae bacterium]
MNGADPSKTFIGGSISTLERLPMITHIALFTWKDGTTPNDIVEALQEVKSLRHKVEGLLAIHCGENFSKWNEGFTHAVVVLAENQDALDAYREHPDHEAVAAKIEAMEHRGIGIDFKD